MRRRHRRKTFTPIVDLATHPEAYCEVAALAAYWKVEVQTVRKWMREGDLHGKRFGRVLRVKTEDARAFDERGTLTNRGHWRTALVTGGLLFLLANGLLSAGLARPLPTGIAALIVGSTPISLVTACGRLSSRTPST